MKKQYEQTDRMVQDDFNSSARHALAQHTYVPTFLVRDDDRRMKHFT